MLRKKEEKFCEMGITRTIREVRPSNFSWTIKCYSYMEKGDLEKYESGVFEVGGYKWRLVLYPNGDKKKNGDGHISLYLALAETEDLDKGWEVNVYFRFFLYEHVQDKYLTVQDSEVRRFHATRTEWGFAQLISLETFKDVSNGYLFDDCCTFGADVFVHKPSFDSECLSMVKPLVNSTYTWKIKKFSTLNDEFYQSDLFAFGGRQWQLRLYPKGYSNANGKSLSLFIFLKDAPELNVFDYSITITIKDQVNGKDYKEEGSHRFSNSSSGWGYSKFIALEVLHDATRGFLKSDNLIVEVKCS